MAIAITNLGTNPSAGTNDSLSAAPIAPALPAKLFLKQHSQEIEKNPIDFFTRNFQQLKPKTLRKWGQLYKKLENEPVLDEREKNQILPGIQAYMRRFEIYNFDFLSDEIVQMIVWLCEHHLVLGDVSRRLASLAKNDPQTAKFFLGELSKRLKVDPLVLEESLSTPLPLKLAKDVVFQFHELRKNQVSYAKNMGIPFPKTEGLLPLQRKMEEHLKAWDALTRVNALTEGIQQSEPLTVFLMLNSFEEIGLGYFQLTDVLNALPHCRTPALWKELDFKLYDLVIKKFPKGRSKWDLLDHFVQAFLGLQNINKAIEAANAIQHREMKGLALIRIVEHLAEQQEKSRAMEVADTISDPTGETIARCAVLTISGEIDQAEEVAKWIFDSDTKSFAFQKIAIILANHGKTDQALEMANKIITGNGLTKSSALGFIALNLIKNGGLDQAEEVANEILDERCKSHVLFTLSNALVRKGLVDKCKEIAERISDEQMKNSALIYCGTFTVLWSELLERNTKLLKPFLKHRGFLDVIAVANLLPDGETKSKAFNIIKKALKNKMKKGDEKMGQVVGEANKEPQIKSLVFKTIAEASVVETETILKALVDGRQLDFAVEFARTTSHESSRELAFRAISSTLAECGEIEQAADVVIDGIPDKVAQSRMLWSISLDFLDKDIDQAIKMAEKIPDETLKAGALAFYRSHSKKQD